MGRWVVEVGRWVLVGGNEGGGGGGNMEIKLDNGPDKIKVDIGTMVQVVNMDHDVEVKEGPGTVCSKNDLPGGRWPAATTPPQTAWWPLTINLMHSQAVVGPMHANLRCGTAAMATQRQLARGHTCAG